MIDQLVHEAHSTAKGKGWWDTDRSVLECIALMHSELSEATEDYRNDGINNDQLHCYLDDNGKPCGIGSELADVCIRIFDFCGRYDVDLGTAITEKMKYNTTRPHRHGGKLA